MLLPSPDVRVCLVRWHNNLLRCSLKALNVWTVHTREWIRLICYRTRLRLSTCTGATFCSVAGLSIWWMHRHQVLAPLANNRVRWAWLRASMQATWISEVIWVQLASLTWAADSALPSSNSKRTLIVDLVHREKKTRCGLSQELSINRLSLVTTKIMINSWWTRPKTSPGTSSLTS